MNLEYSEESVDRLPESEVHELVAITTADQFGHLEPPAKKRRTPLVPAAIALVLLGAVAWHLLVPQPVQVAVASPIQDVVADLSGRFVAPGSVPYGPDIAPGLKIDTSFHPGGALPQGLAATSSVDKLLWGCGNRKVGGAHPPDSTQDRETVRRRIAELADKARQEAQARHLKSPNIDPDYDSPMEPGLGTKLPSIRTVFSLEWRNGSASASADIPLGDSPQARKERDTMVSIITKRLCDYIGDGIQFIRQNDPNVP